MARIPTPTAPADDEPLDDEMTAFVEEALEQLPDTIVVLERCTLVHQSLMRNGQGIEVKFLLPLSEKEKLPDLMNALQRSVTVAVYRHRRPA